MLHFFYGIPRVVFLTAPLSYLYFELHIIGAAASTIALYVLPHVVLPHITNAHVQGAHRHSFWAEVYETVLAWYITLPTTVAFINPKLGKFNVTAKGGLVTHTHFDWHISRPYIVLAALNGLGLALGLVRLVWWNRYEAGTVALNLIWTVFNLLMLGAAIGVARERRQVRVAHRVAARVPACLLLPRGQTHRCHTVDYSMNGLGLELGEPLPLEAGTRLQVMLESGSAEHVFQAQVVGRRGVLLGLQFEPLTLEQQQALIQCTFARADAWTGWDHRFDRDKPMQGLKEIFTLGIEGYRTLFDSFAKGTRRRYRLASERLRAMAAEF
jgi:cellulose synthase (UDP-forming)